MCAIPILWVIQCYHLLNTFQFLLTDQLADHHRAVVVFCLVGFCFGFCVFVCLLVPLLSLLVSLLVYTVTALWIMYRSTQAPFDAHCRHDDVATALIRGICKVQLAVRIDKRPGESHTALDGKKDLTSISIPICFVRTPVRGDRMHFSATLLIY